MKKESITIIEVSETLVKVLRAQTGRGNNAFCYADVRKMDGDSDDAVSKLLLEMLPSREEDPERLALVLPRRNVLFKKLVLPSQSPEEIRRMLDLHMNDYVPYVLEEVVYDFYIVEKERTGHSRILLVVALQEVVQRYLAILNSAKMSAGHVVLSSFGHLEWLAYQKNKKSVPQPDPLALIIIDHAGSEVCFVAQGKMYYSRWIGYGLRDLTEAQLPEFVGQIELAFDGYIKDQWGPDVAGIAIVSDAKEAELLQGRLQGLHPQPVERWSSVAGLPCVNDLDLAVLVSRVPCSLTSVSGFLLGGLQKQCSLMPLHFQVTKEARKTREVLLRFLILGSVTLGLLLFALSGGGYRDSVYLHKLEKRLSAVKPLAAKAEKRIATVDLLQNNLQDRILIADVIKELYRLTPDEVRLSVLSFDQKKSLVIQGSLPGSMSVNTFQGNLINSRIFKEANLEYATKKQDNNGEYTEFMIVCKLSFEKGLTP